MKFIALVSGRTTSDPLTLCFTIWLRKSWGRRRESWVSQPLLQSQLRDRFVRSLTSGSLSTWWHNPISLVWIYSYLSQETRRRRKLLWRCSAQTPTKISILFSSLRHKDVQPNLWQRTWIPRASLQQLIMLERAMNSEPLLKSSSAKTRLEYFVALLLLVWVSTSLISKV